ncbi:MAG TPA: aminopeptidase P family protein [candidate division Zixibacteria bacterium]|nr:aminopeptidase P family protein [candidate division Zixibacteria bacterium]
MPSNLKRLQQLVKKENLDCLLVTDVINIRYLTGYSGSSAKMLVFPTQTYFFTDFRYKDQVKKEVKGAKIEIGQRDPMMDFPKFKPLQKKNITIGFQSEHMTHAILEHLKELLPDAVLIPTKGLVGSLSIIKTQAEIKLIREAVKISDKAFDRILGYIQPGLRENEIAAELEYQMKMLGSERPAFDTIVASGPRSAMPHGVASDRKVQKGDFITMDFGAVYKGYHSDMTRTIVVGKATQKQKKIYNLVLKAQKAGCRYAKAGMTGKELDKKVRNIIEKAGYGKNFGHGLGHGLGTVVHDSPPVSPLSDVELRPNMVVTIEPGIYISGWGGVRIEDDVVLKKNSCVILNKAEKELIEL